MQGMRDGWAGLLAQNTKPVTKRQAQVIWSAVTARLIFNAAGYILTGKLIRDEGYWAYVKRLCQGVFESAEGFSQKEKRQVEENKDG